MKSKTLVQAKEDHGLLEEIAALPEGERVLSCLQCGTCSATCPVAALLEHSPRRIFAMIRAGMKEQVLGSVTPWLCSSCYDCTVKCPAQIKITEVMYALKRRSIREGLANQNSDVHRFYQLFTEIVCKHGRIHELLLLLKYMALRHPLSMLSQGPVGLRMFGTGCMRVQPHRMKYRESFAKIVDKASLLEE
ncbi:MAG: 4Fe-4S dicluster domain-containing protein [Candidatus Eiseniibacteriota bacterium]|nr:MAG: 4Fe-4S dicluster domain-containing protein [Candidatus Eisenbacteria bacterium]